MKKNIEKNLCDELNDKLLKCEEQLYYYQARYTPKYIVGKKLFGVDIQNKKVKSFKVDEIIINILGIAYREYISETEFVQFPETFVFDNLIDANLYLKNLK